VHLLDKDSIGSFRIRVSYPFALIAAGMKILVTGFGPQAKKKRATFLARVSTLYSFLFESSLRLDLDSYSTRLHCIAMLDASLHLILTLRQMRTSTHEC